ncbi:MerR family transcriptional regulator [Actinomadura scrupuli]|uniref:MerR family transcriptional regulator n=1 Tax=Actinomadura scrupuli TaxID=559629 RepID=UPI003D99224C
MDGPGLSVGAVARRLGVAPSTLRTWDRRYGIGPTRRSTGGHRRYAPQDLARLEFMNRLIMQGTPPEEAARTALSTEPPPSGPAGAAAPGALGAPAEGPVKGGGGHRLAVPRATPETRALARAAMALDDQAMDRLITTALRRDGVVPTWQDLLVPVLTGIGDRHASTGACVEIEHLLSGRVLGALGPLIARPDEVVNARPVLLACADEELHDLPLYALGAALSAERIAVRLFGSRVPYPALADAIERIGPAVVFVWSQTSQTGDPAPLAGLPGRRPALRLIAGGPGWAYDRLPGEVRPVRTLPEAITEIRSALGLA